MKKNILNDDNNAGWFNNVLFVVGLTLAAFIIYWLVRQIQDAGGIAGFAENLGLEAGYTAWGLISGATTGFFTGAWKTGTEIGEATDKYNPLRSIKTIWTNYFG
jgi:hypothetical protein